MGGVFNGLITGSILGTDSTEVCSKKLRLMGSESTYAQNTSSLLAFYSITHIAKYLTDLNQLNPLQNRLVSGIAE